jgi:hypothetical protein
MTRKTTAPPMSLPSLSRPTADRAECPVCHKQTGLTDVGKLAEHVAHPSVRPRGVYALCAGAGQLPAGPVIHSAEMTRRLT